MNRSSGLAGVKKSGVVPEGIRVTEPIIRPARPSLEQEQLYRSVLHRHLAGMEIKEIEFFVNPRRFELLDRLIGDELRRKGAEILNVACGPFAIEFYLQLRDANIMSFDLETRLTGLHRQLIDSGLIAQTSFDVASIEAFAAPRAFDVIIINDLFYLKFVDFYALIETYIGHLKPGGLLYFDIQDQRARPIWKAFGKEGRNRRYDLGDVGRLLVAQGMKIESMTPLLGIKGSVDRAFRKVLWHTAGLSNSFVFVARKTGGA